jgi:hypothetical protein
LLIGDSDSGQGIHGLAQRSSNINYLRNWVKFNHQFNPPIQTTSSNHHSNHHSNHQFKPLIQTICVWLQQVTIFSGKSD